MKTEISASILSCNLGEINKEIKSVESHVDRIHFDVMDGHFVPNISFGAPVLKDIKSEKPIEVHLMIENPDDFIDDFAKAGAHTILVHQENCPHLNGTLRHIKAAGCKAGIVLNPATPLPTLEDVIEEVDMVLLMSVNPGFSGQKFIPNVLAKIMHLRELMPDLDIEVDGGINKETGKLCREAGANILVSASYIFGAKDRKKAIQSLKK